MGEFPHSKVCPEAMCRGPLAEGEEDKGTPEGEGDQRGTLGLGDTCSQGGSLWIREFQRAAAALVFMSWGLSIASNCVWQDFAGWAKQADSKWLKICL